MSQPKFQIKRSVLECTISYDERTVWEANTYQGDSARFFMEKTIAMVRHLAKEIDIEIEEIGDDRTPSH